MAINNGQKAKIHIAKNQVGMTDEEYKDLLASVGMASAADPKFSDAAYRIVMDRFKALGFVPKRKNRPRTAKGKEALIGKIRAIRNDLGLTDTYIDAMAQQMFGISAYTWLKADQLHKLVAALSYHQNRNGKRFKPDKRKARRR